jgi:hypothetical protein
MKIGFSIQDLKDLIAKINQETNAEAEFVRFIPCASVRKLDGSTYTLVYIPKAGKFRLVKRENIGLFTESELMEYLNENPNQT